MDPLLLSYSSQDDFAVPTLRSPSNVLKYAPGPREEPVDAQNENLAPVIVSVHTLQMRANVNLDTDVYNFASSYASAKGIPLGAAISELLRRAEQAPEPVSVLMTESRLGLLVRTKQDGDKVVTREMVKELSEDDLD